MLNQVTLLGYMKFEPEVKILKSNKEIVTFEIQVGRDYRDSEGKHIYDYISCRSFIPGLVRYLSTYIKKGSQLIVGGRFQTDLYTSSDGKSRKASYLMVDHVELVKMAQNTTPIQKEKEKDPLEDVDW